MEGLVGLVSQAARRWLHLGLVALLTSAFVLQLIKDVSVRSAVLLAAALAVGCLAAAFYDRSSRGAGDPHACWARRRWCSCSSS